jgi:hypothetical protein
VYPRIKNLTNVKFNKEEMQLLKYGLHYSIEKSTTTYLANILAETEQAIKFLDRKVQNTYRILATNKLKQIFSSTNHQNPLQKRQRYVIQELNQKLATENSIIAQANKGKRIVFVNYN